MPHATKPSADPRDRILDYLTGPVEVTEDATLIMEGILKERTISVADRSVSTRGDMRRFYMRISKPGSLAVDFTRVYAAEASVVAALDGLEKGLDIKRPARGVAAKRKRTPTKAPSRVIRDRRTGLPTQGKRRALRG
jgi:hypothetical protein